MARHLINKKNSPNLYGFHTVREAWLNEERIVQTLYLTPQSVRGFEETLSESQKRGLKRPKPTIVEKQNLERLLPKGAVHQGTALTCAPLEEIDLQDFIIKSHSRERFCLAMLDQVTDPHNVGAIIRSACAFGIDGIIMQKKHAPTLDGVLAKSACGGIEHVPVAYVTNLNRAIEELRESLFLVCGLDSETDQFLSNIPANNKIMMILGAEGKGMRHSLREKCDLMVKLPTIGPIASLNVSNAAAIAFYALSMHGDAFV
ncbi:MAG: 23S rRNA (guanosine(2251)-2'-O)-methyltransferase RlmB [Alphaproteobacteria bacterium]|nr:23S rRNA (guanosine(2251)-2'-O)-methyltransferase RlmB [Alphaproteobacteria bacterium]